MVDLAHTATDAPVSIPRVQAQASRLAPDQDPRRVYLLTLEASSRRVVDRRLAQVATISGVAVDEFPWAELRYQHIAAIREYFTVQHLAPNTINLTLAALRGVAREAWNLGYSSAEDYQRVKSVKGVRGERLPAGWSLQSGELRALLHICAADRSPASVRDGAILALLYGAGLRRDELATDRRITARFPAHACG